ncbi:MAG: MaoC family dehydratase [Gemmatimonadaceae bacterium]
MAVGMSAESEKTVSESDVALFARVTGDMNPVHLDPEAAARSVFGGRVAHGMLTASLISAVMAMKLPGPGTIYLSQSLRFLAPVRIGDTVTARVEIAELVAEKHRARLITTCRNQRGEPVLDGEATVKVPAQ